MKIKATRKSMKESYNTIICIGYCEAQYLLQYENEIAYSTRAEGWACDYYDINGVLISTGYAPLTEKNSKRDYATTRKYEEQAQKIVCDSSIPYDEKPVKVRALLNEYITEVTK